MAMAQLTHNIGSTYKGMSLIELLIATAIGLFIVGGALTLFTRLRAIEQHANKILELQENATFALGIIGHDLRMANYWGLHNDPTKIVVDSAPPVVCRGEDVSNWALQPMQPIELNGTLLPCAAPNSAGDTLTTRHVTSSPQRPDSRYLQLQTDYQLGYFHADATPDYSGMQSPENYYLVVNSYYLNDVSHSGIPELRRWTLGSHRKFYNELISPNISDLQILWGENTANEWHWHKNSTPKAALARVEITASDIVGGRHLHQTMSQIFRLHNMPNAAMIHSTTQSAP